MVAVNVCRCSVTKEIVKEPNTRGLIDILQATKRGPVASCRGKSWVYVVSKGRRYVVEGSCQETRVYV